MNIGQLFVLFGLKINKSEFKAATDALKVLKAAAVITGVVGIARDIMHLAETAGESATHVVSFAKAMGMSLEQTQQWGYVAQQSGSNLKELSVGINMFLRNLRLYSEGRGSKVLADRFRELKLSVADAKAALASPGGLQQILYKTSDALKAMGGTGREATFTQIFGVRAGRAMLADLERGSAGIRELMARQKEIGGVVGEQQILDLRMMANAINDVKVGWRGVTAQILGFAAPALTQLLEDSAKWFAHNRELIGELLLGAVHALVGAFQAVMVVVNVVAGLIRKALAGDTGAQAIIITVAGLLVSLLIPAIAAVGVAIWTATAPLLPITLILAAIIMLVLEVHKHWDGIVKALGNAWSQVKDKASAFWQWLGRTVAAVGRGLALLPKLLWDALAAIGGSVFGLLSRIGSWFKNLPEDIKRGLGAAIDAVGRFFSDLWRGLVRDANRAWDLVVEAARAAWHKIRGLPGIRWFLDQPHAPGVSADAGSTPRTAAMLTNGPMLAAPVTNVPRGAFGGAPIDPETITARQPRHPGPVEVSVGGTTINLYGIKDAMEAKEHIADSIDGIHRHAAAALGGEVQ